MAGEHLRDVARESDVARVGGGQVHRDSYAVAGVEPRAHLPQRFVEHVQGERLDEMRRLDDRKKLAGAEQSSRRVLPTDERFDRVGAPGAQIDLRLVVQDELVLFDCPADLRRERESLHAEEIVLHGVFLDAGAGPLRHVHRDVGVAEQRGGVGAVVGASHADARAHVDLDAVDLERLFECERDVFGDHDRVLRVRQTGQHDAELVAAEPRDGVLGAEPLGDPGADLVEQLVARLVPERVVDLLEAVEVEQQRGRDRPVAQRLPRHLFEAVGEQRPVR